LVRLHLPPDRVEMLGTPGHLGGEALLGEPRRERLADVGDVLVALALRLRDRLLDLRVAVDLEEAEREILELALEALDAEAVGERRVDLHRLARDALLRLARHVLKRPHVVDAIAELDEKDADVLRHSDDHLAEVLRLAVLLRREVDLAKFRDAIDQARD